MWADLINTGIGLVLGLFTGFYFERRSTKEAQQQNAELEAQLATLKRESRQNTDELEAELAKLRVGVYTVGADIPQSNAAPRHAESLNDAVLARARQIQDAEGRLSRTLLTSHFFALGHRSADVDDAIGELCEAGLAREDGKWLEVL